MLYFSQLAEERRLALEKANLEKLAEKEKRAEMVEKFETSCETDDETKFKLSIFGRITSYFPFSFLRSDPQFFMKYTIYNQKYFYTNISCDEKKFTPASAKYAEYLE